MTIEELNKLIAEELKAYLNENEDEDMDAPEADGDDDIEVTTDEPAVDTGEEAMDTLRQIYDMLKPVVEPEEGGEDMDMDMDDEEPADEEGEEEGGEEEEMVDEGMFDFLKKKKKEAPPAPKKAPHVIGVDFDGNYIYSDDPDGYEKLKPIGKKLEPALEAVDNHTFFRGDNANRVKPEPKDVQGRREKVNESVARFKKLANIKG